MMPVAADSTLEMKMKIYSKVGYFVYQKPDVWSPGQKNII
jgi:hypothetical protein